MAWNQLQSLATWSLAIHLYRKINPTGNKWLWSSWMKIRWSVFKWVETCSRLEGSQWLWAVYSVVLFTIFNLLTLHVWGSSFSVPSLLFIFFPLLFSIHILYCLFPGYGGLVQIPPKDICCALGSSRAVRRFFCENLWCFSEWSKALGVQLGSCHGETVCSWFSIECSCIQFSSHN